MPYFNKKSLKRIVCSTSNEYKEGKLHLRGFICKKEMETVEDCLTPMSHLGHLVAGLSHLPEQV